MSKHSEKLWAWFELSYVSFLTLPRVLMHEMPKEWQDKMADLLDEYDETFPNQPDIGTRVQCTKDGKLVKWPPWLLNYRYPDREVIARLRLKSTQYGNKPHLLHEYEYGICIHCGHGMRYAEWRDIKCFNNDKVMWMRG